jgi:hypothetical protein
MAAATCIAHAQIAAWDFSGESSPATSAADVFNANLASSNLITRGAGAASSAGTNSFRTQGFKNDGINVANTDYFEVTISAAVGYSLSLSSIDAKFNGTTSFAVAPGVTHQFAYSLDGTAFTLIGSPQVTVGTSTPLTMGFLFRQQRVLRPGHRGFGGRRQHQHHGPIHRHHGHGIGERRHHQP